MIKLQVNILVISIFKYEIHKSLPELPNGRQGHNRTQINLLRKNLTSFIERFLNWLKFDQNLILIEGF